MFIEYTTRELRAGQQGRDCPPIAIFFLKIRCWSKETAGQIGPSVMARF